MKDLHRAAIAAVVVSFSSIASAQIHFERTRDGNRLLWSSDVPVYTTTAAVDALRVIDAPNSRTVIATWRESEAGTSAPHYAISLDGQHVDVVRQTSYELQFRRARFDPLREAPSFEDSPFESAGELYVVQYVTQPLLEFTNAITAAGGRVYDFVESHAHIVRMNATARDAVARLPFVRWIGAYHPEFHIEPEVLAALRAGVLSTARYNVLVFERGLAQQQLIAARVEELCGTVHAMTPPGFRMEVTLTPEQLVAIGSLDEVRYIDRWSPPGTDMNIVRQLGGADYLEATPGNFKGQGVSGEVLDEGCDLTHPDFVNEIAHGNIPVAAPHGTCTAGCAFSSGAGNPLARGVLPSGRLVVGYFPMFVGGNRYTHTAELVNPALPYQCVFQSNSWGSGLTTSYNSVSAELDDIALQYDFLIVQAQSNTGTQSSRPEAWSKNVLSVGGIVHNDNLTTNDDLWTVASIGPAGDGRLKPDLAHFSDSIHTLDVVGAPGNTTGNYYASFHGTSAATAITAGHAGLFFQLWHAGIFGNSPSGATVFASRPHVALAKAALINTASQWSFSGTSHNLTRAHQGWGRTDVKTLYDLRAKTFFVDQTDVVSNLGVVDYDLDVPVGEPALRVTLVYRDAMGSVSSMQDRKNDLSLEVIAPDATTYWGNSGLDANMWSTAGGSPNTKDTVENVFVQSPQAGTWRIAIHGDDINTDPLTNAPASSTDFALWVTGVTGLACTNPQVYCTSKLTSIATLPSVGYAGSPSVAGNNFTVTLTNAVPGKNGITFYGVAQHNAPFMGGTLCAQQPLERSPIVTTDAQGGASIPVALDLTMVGTTRYYQWWFRDPTSSFSVGLSDGLSVTFCN